MKKHYWQEDFVFPAHCSALQCMKLNTFQLDIFDDKNLVHAIQYFAIVFNTTFLSTLVALHFTPVSKSVTRSVVVLD